MKQEVRLEELKSLRITVDEEHKRWAEVRREQVVDQIHKNIEKEATEEATNRIWSAILERVKATKMMVDKMDELIKEIEVNRENYTEEERKEINKRIETEEVRYLVYTTM